MATLSYFLLNDVASISISSDTVLAGLVQLTSPLIVVIVQLTYQGIAGLAGVASYGGSGELWARGRASWQPFIWPSWRARSVRPIKTGNHPLDTRTRKYMLVWAIKFNLPTVNHTSFNKWFIDFHPWLAKIGKLRMSFCPPPPPSGLYLGVVGRLTGPKTQLTQAKIIILRWFIAYYTMSFR